MELKRLSIIYYSCLILFWPEVFSHFLPLYEATVVLDDLNMGIMIWLGWARGLTLSACS